MLTDFVTLSPADTLEDALDKGGPHTAKTISPWCAAVDMAGVISRHAFSMLCAPTATASVQAAMNRIYDVAGKQESLASASANWQRAI